MICEALWVTAIINKLSITMLYEVVVPLTSCIQLFVAILSLLCFFTKSGKVFDLV